MKRDSLKILGIEYKGLQHEVDIEFEKRKVIESIIRAIRENPDDIINWMIEKSGNEISVGGYIEFIPPKQDKEK